MRTRPKHQPAQKQQVLLGALKHAWIWRSLFSLLAGVLVYAAFPPPLSGALPLQGSWWLAPIGVGLWGALLRGSSLVSGAVLGSCFGLGLFAPLLHFAAIAMGNAVGWVALTITELLYLTALGLAWAAASRLKAFGAEAKWWTGLARVGAFTLLWCGVEELRASWPLGGMPFGRLAFAAADAPMLPIAAYGGSIALTACLACLGACLAEVMQALRVRHWPRLAPVFACGALVVVLPSVLPLSTQAQTGTLRVAAVQGNVAKDFEDAFGRALEVTSNHLEATRAVAQETGPGGVDVVIWPENSADLDPRAEPRAAALVQEAATTAGAPVLVGAIKYANDGPAGRTVRYNDLLLWDQKQGAGNYYRKHLPVPFAEYIPWRGFVRHITTEVDRIGVDLLPGTEGHTLAVPAASQGREVPLAVGICFEVAYDSALRAGVLEGGELIVVPTNNASFLLSSEAGQQLAQGRVQAVVHGRAVVQASTVGITAIINPAGQVEQATKAYTQAGLVAEVPLRSSQTWADRLGPWPGIVLELGAAALALAGILGATIDAVARRRAQRR
ncbi:Apolipoprotein N-acyltransferase [Actinomyces bovis]|uniref:Apolipoprotein N-acyltransferase n=1 Tax=Actinomyces bovis TaxID=1658 RepID=A0ABY1VRF8_9ACTO|nr:apolipoprotein N-acyltransferase [Actinomyces bovis]SPT54012.1 Apolipoprotein N-acyltransferase [Actinomyces bovis]VEG53858.1 Apolipoprotein N-acyltransferase [Actinomyces israelii]